MSVPLPFFLFGVPPEQSRRIRVFRFLFQNISKFLFRWAIYPSQSMCIRIFLLHLGNGGAGHYQSPSSKPIQQGKTRPVKGPLARCIMCLLHEFYIIWSSIGVNPSILTVHSHYTLYIHVRLPMLSWGKPLVLTTVSLWCISMVC